jgi:hypothetical protein
LGLPDKQKTYILFVYFLKGTDGKGRIRIRYPVFGSGYVSISYGPVTVTLLLPDPKTATKER